MALPIHDLETAFTNTTIALAGATLRYRLDYAVIHVPTQTVVQTGTRQATAPSLKHIPSVDAQLRGEIAADVQQLCEYHKTRPALGGLSYYDAIRVLDRWSFYPTSSGWTLTHPVSGVFEDVSMPETGIVARFNAIRSLVLPPSIWTTVTGGTGEIVIRCIPVADAAEYKIYNDHTYLATVPTPGLQTVPLAVGTYRIRMGGVDDGGVTGILGNETVVTVAAGAAAVETTTFAAPKPKRALTPSVVRVLKRLQKGR